MAWARNRHSFSFLHGRFDDEFSRTQQNRPHNSKIADVCFKRCTPKTFFVYSGGGTRIHARNVISSKGSRKPNLISGYND